MTHHARDLSQLRLTLRALACRSAEYPTVMLTERTPFLTASTLGSAVDAARVSAAAVVFQALMRRSDFNSVQELRCDLWWKAAYGPGLLDSAFDPSLLSYFRRRLARSGRRTLPFGEQAVGARHGIGG